MKKYRHTVEKINPETPRTFDQQFWPVLVAIVVLCSIAAGAITTLLNGPWMWGSLLVLPISAAISVVILYQVDDSILRRSLQMAILSSLAVHLLILVVTSLTQIFGAFVPENQEVVSRTPERKIVVTNRAKKFVFQKPIKHEIQEKQVETTKRESSPVTQPQTNPSQTQRNISNQQLVKRERTESTIPRLDREMSKLSRRESERTPKPSQPAETQFQSSKVSPQAVTKSASQTKMAKSTSRSNSTSSSSTSQQTDPSSAVPMRAVELSSKRVTKDSASRNIISQAKARIRKPQVRMPKIAAKEPTKFKKEFKTSPTKTTISEQSKVAVGKSTPTSRPTRSTSQPKTNRRSEVVNKLLRRPNTAASQPIATTTNSKTQDRKLVSKRTNKPSTQAKPWQSTKVASSKANSNSKPQPRNVSVSRSASGKIGSGRSQNMDRVKGGEPSPIRVASDSSSRRQRNRESENLSMTSTQQSSRLEKGKSVSSQRVLQSNSIRWSTKSGESQSSELTLVAAAALLDSSSSSSRAPAASEKGTSMLDLGPTKISPEFASERRGGGGLPEISLNAAESTRSPSGRTSSFAPQIAAAELQFEFQSLSELQTLGQIGKPSDEQMELARNSTPSKPTQKSKSSDSIESSSLTSSAKITASSGRRAQSKPSEIEANFKQDRASEGNSKSRIAQAPRVDNHPEFGKTGAEDFSSDSQASNPDESVASQLVQRATASIGGSGVLGKATQVMAGSMTGMPLFSNGREGKGKSKRRANESISIGESDNRSRKEATRTGKMAKPNVSNLDHLKNSPTAVTEISKLRDAQPGLGELSKSSTKKLTGNPMDIEIESDLGVGGLGQVASRRVGKRSDVIRDSQNFTPDSNVRFRRKEFGGRPTISPTANLAKEAFSKRNPASLGDSGPQTEAAIELGLEFLVNCQLADGSWTLRQFDTENPLYQNVMNSDTAATGLALLAFQGAGYNHKEFKYANQVKNGIDWLVEHQDSNGGLYVESDQKSNDACRMYSHAIAALALAEAYGMTQDPELQRPAQKALDYISNTQDTRKGGWRYFADPSRRSSDTSVTGWMMMALKSGQLAGLQAPGHTLQKIDTWLGVALVPNSAGQFRYNPYAVDSDGKLRTHGRKASTPMTSVGLLMRVYTGWGPKDPRFLQGAQTLLNQLPSETNSRSRDTYYWYYATQVMKHAGGDYWERWRERLHPLLIGTQQTSGPMRGSWDPFNPVPDRWGPQGGRIYVTTMNLLSLEVKYRLLPLYENTFK